MMKDIDLVQIFSSEPCLLPIIMKAKRRNIPVVVTPMIGSRAMSNITLKCVLKLSTIPGLFSPHKERYRLIQQADYLLALSVFEMKRLIDVYKFERGKIAVVENGLDSKYVVSCIDSQNVNDKDNYILTVGRIEPNKNQYNLIKAANNLGMELYIVGEPGIRSENYMEKCKSISNDNIHYLGAIRDVDRLKYLYTKAIVTVIPSYSEMVPLTVFESLSVKTPVVLTKYSSLKGTRLNGLFFSGTTSHAIGSTIKKALSFDRSLITSDGIFDWRQIAEKYLNVYKKFC